MITRKLLQIPRLLVYLLAVTLIPGCQSINAPMYDIGDYSSASIRASIAVGDFVEVSTTSGEDHAFEVVALDVDSLSGENLVIYYEEIESLQVRGAHSESQAGVIVASVLLLIVGLALIAAGSSNSGGFLEGGLFQ